MSKDGSFHKRDFSGFCISKTNNFFCFVFNLGRGNQYRINYLFILPSKDILIKLSSLLLSFHKIIDHLTPTKKGKYDHRIRDSLSKERIMGSLDRGLSCTLQNASLASLSTEQHITKSR